jgi:predicted alpha/beta hydrolase family esterase
MKRLFIIHGWAGSSQDPLLAWIKEHATALGFEVTSLDMPGTETPTIGAWVNHLRSAVEYIEENTFFVTHSMGAQALLRYLQEPDGIALGGAVLIAPFTKLTGLQSEEEKNIARPWEENPIDWNKVRANGGKYVSIFSDNDHLVSLAENSEVFAKQLNSKIVVEQGKGHFTDGDGVASLASAIDALKEISA